MTLEDTDRVVPRYWPGEAPVVLIGAGLNLLQWRAVRWASRSSRWRVWLTAVVTVLACAMVYSGSLRILAAYIPIMMPKLHKTLWLQAMWYTIYFSSWFVLWVAIVTILESERVARRRERQLSNALIAARPKFARCTIRSIRTFWTVH